MNHGRNTCLFLGVCFIGIWVILAPAGCPGTEPVPCDPPAQQMPGTDVCIQIFSPDDRITWSSAQSLCEQDFSGSLIVIDSQETQNFVASLADQVIGMNNLWIGLSDLRREGQFEWVDGTPVTYTNWAESEPNNGNGAGEEDCVGMYHPNLSRQWNDFPCERTYPYGCQWLLK